MTEKRKRFNSDVTSSRKPSPVLQAAPSMICSTPLFGVLTTMHLHAFYIHAVRMIPCTCARMHTCLPNYVCVCSKPTNESDLGQVISLLGLSCLIFKMRGSESVGHVPKRCAFTLQTPNGVCSGLCAPFPVGRQAAHHWCGLIISCQGHRPCVLKQFVYYMSAFWLSLHPALKNICVLLNGHALGRSEGKKKNWRVGGVSLLFKRPQLLLLGI